MTQEIKTEKFDGLLVKVPEKIKDIQIGKLADYDPDDYLYLLIGERYTKLPTGQWKLIGKPFELSEGECGKIVVHLKDSGYPFEVESPIDTLNELLASLKVYKENPYGDKSSILNNNDFENTKQWIERSKRWQEAEERTGNWVLIQKIG